MRLKWSTEPAATGQVSPGGFPTWIPSMLVKELRQGLRTPGFVGAFMLFQGVMALVMLSALVMSVDASNMGRRAAMVRELDALFWAALAVLLLVIMPGRALVGLKSEINNRSLDLLVLTRLTAWRIVLGKWGSLMAQSCLLMITVVPYGIVRYFAGTANLLFDASLSAAMLALSGLLTAICLWASALGRVMGVLLIILVGIGVVNGEDILQNLERMVTRRSSAAAGVIWPIVFAGFVTLAFCLVGAVRRIAPVAENYSLAVRGLGPIALLAIPVMSVTGATTSALSFMMVFVMLLLAVISLMELSSNQLPMAVHCRNYSDRGWRGRLIAAFMLPGWQTAMVYGLIMTLCLMVCIHAYFPLMSPGDKWQVTWWIVLAYGALVFPAVAASFITKRGQPMLKYYLLVFLSMCLLAGGGLALHETVRWFRDAELIRTVAVFPVAGFWLAYERFPGEELFVQGAFITVVFVVGLRQSIGYWARVAEFNLKARQRK